MILKAVGDISFARRIEGFVREHGDAYPWEPVRNLLNGADLLFGNLESVMIPPDFPQDQTNQHFQVLASDDSMTSSLQSAGFDIVNLAANHILDCGWQGLLHTQKRIEEAGMMTLGVGDGPDTSAALKTKLVGDTRVGFLSYIEMNKWTMLGGGGRVAYYDSSVVLQAVVQAKKQVDTLVVSFHGDTEFSKAPALPRVKEFRQLAEAGADVILAHHPHVPQGVEMWEGSLIAYSLGNFAFDTGPYQHKHSPVDSLRSYILSVEIVDGCVVGWSRDLLKINLEEARPEPLTQTEQAEHAAHYEQLDQLLRSDETIREHWHENCRYWLEHFWPEIIEHDPNKLIEQFGWHWVHDFPQLINGLKDMAEVQYQKHAGNDFEWTRPFSPFE